MNVLQEILAWSQDRPMWQRDALRRIVQSMELSELDVTELTMICKGAKGLAEPQNVIVLSSDHLPQQSISSDPVSLVSIFHERGVNALAENQTLNFSSRLTVVYGDNGAGKTGYIRILKEACRARGKETVLGNVTSGQLPLTPIVTIKYKAGSMASTLNWPTTVGEKWMARVSVFDSQSAAVYLTEKTDVAFRPFGLDLFDKLVKACKAVRIRLEAEQRALTSSMISTLIAIVPEGTRVAKFLANVTSLTSPEDVHSLATLTSEDDERIKFLEKSIADLHAADTRKLVQQLTLRSGRMKALVQHLKAVDSALSSARVDRILQIRSTGMIKADQAKRLHGLAFPAGVLPGTGSDTWKNLWESARVFSTGLAYSNQAFPVVGRDSKCVLCQQGLDDEASSRLKKFEEFVISAAEQELAGLRTEFTKLKKEFIDLTIKTPEIDGILSELRIDNEAEVDKISKSIEAYQERRVALLGALAENKEFTAHAHTISVNTDLVDEMISQVEARIKALATTSMDEARKNANLELSELKARKLFSIQRQLVLDDINRQRRFAAYSLCIDETATQSITRKSSTVTQEAVSQRLKDRFNEELAKLQFNHAGVELKEDGGSEGVLYHKLVLTHAPGVDLPKVASEGEQRCLSIAAFFAELSTADDPSGIVFDDPISSLDFKWRQTVARRLVEEAKSRQVIVFTHDIVFLLLLKQIAEELQVEQLDQHVQKSTKGAGITTAELPWVAMPVKKKIGYLKNAWQTADKLFREDNLNAYEKEAAHLYGLLRSAWERGLEQVLLGGIVERFRESIQTQQIESIADIAVEECRILDTAMTKCSKWIAGHDQAAAARAPIPEPAELKRDIENLENWVETIRKRRS